jgi:uncharacterized protein (TIGR03083 family)
MTNEHDDLIAAWALDALPPDEWELLDRALAADLGARADADELRHVVALLGEDHAAPAPGDLRERVLAAVRSTAQRVESPVASAPIDVYRHQTETLSALLDTLADDDWRAVAEPYDWTVHGLLAHLLTIERYMGRLLGIVDGDPVADEHDHLAIGGAEIAAELTNDPIATVDAWRSAVAINLSGLAEVDLDRVVVFHEFRFAVRTLLIARGFELWTHADDIRRAAARPVGTPPKGDVRTMSSASVRSLPLAIHVVPGATVPDGTARIVLTGDGGGTFDLVLGRGGERLVTIVADVVDYCRVASRRLLPIDAEMTVDGDARLAGDLLAASSVVAV